MQLIAFELHQKYSYSDPESQPLIGSAKVKVESGGTITIELSVTQAEAIAASIAELLTKQAQHMGGELKTGKIQIPKVDNILEA